MERTDTADQYFTVTVALALDGKSILSVVARLPEHNRIGVVMVWGPKSMQPADGVFEGLPSPNLKGVLLLSQTMQISPTSEPRLDELVHDRFGV